jgi:hypothetical protein
MIGGRFTVGTGEGLKGGLVGVGDGVGAGVGVGMTTVTSGVAVGGTVSSTAAEPPQAATRTVRIPVRVRGITHRTHFIAAILSRIDPTAKPEQIGCWAGTYKTILGCQLSALALKGARWCPSPFV